MAKRNMIKIAESARGMIDHHYDMSFDEISLLYAIVKRGYAAEAIAAAFRYGFVLGHRATVNGAYKAAGKGGKKK